MEIWVWVVFGVLVVLSVYFVVYNAAATKRRIQDSAVFSPDGLETVFAVGGEIFEPLPESHDSVHMIPLSQKVRKYECGHTGPTVFMFDTWGERSKRIVQAGLCPDCFQTKVISTFTRCAKCGLPILPGDGVALYSANSLGLRQGIGQAYKKGVVACLRMGCCPSGGYFAGHWTTKGFEPAHDSGATVVDHVYATGEVAKSSKLEE